ncbi:MAG: hypothetical protein JW870_05465 [Candidatus Delongbacteria bacterium]|nr:hypothetical protein [Candidatus Delongbacteria bacterium]
MKCLIEIKNNIYKFKQTYHENFFTSFPNIFVGDINDQFVPLVPYSIFDNKIVINPEKYEDQNEGKFLGSLLSLIKSVELSKLTLLGYQHPNSLSGNQILSNNESFFPKTFNQDIISKFKYLEKFIKVYEDIQLQLTTAFHLEFAKFYTLYKLLLQKQKEESRLSKDEIIPGIIYNLLFDYHSLYKDNESYKKLVFNFQIQIDKSNLFEIYKSVYSSIKKFISEICTENLVDIEKLFLFELLKIEELCNKFWQEPHAITSSKKSCKWGDNIENNFSEIKELKRCKVDFKNDERLLLNDRPIFYVNEEEQAKIFVLKVFAKKQHQITKLQTNDISNFSEEMYYKEKGEIILLVDIDNTIELSYTTIKDRKINYEESRNNNRRFYINCYEYPKSVDRIIQENEKEFQNALKVLENHYYKSTIFETSKDLYWHLINWLRLFAAMPEIVVHLLRIIAAHQTLTPESIENFKEKIEKLQINQNNIFVSLKILEDHNGLHRLLDFTSQRNLFNRLNFVNNILEAKIQKQTSLILLGDIGISGFHMIDGLKYYYCREDFAISTNQDEIKKNDRSTNKSLRKSFEKYYDISESQVYQFRKKLKEINRIMIVVSAYTDTFQETVRKFIKEEIDKNIDISFFPEQPTWNIRNCFLSGNPKIRQKSVEQFMEFYKDVDKLKGIFHITNDIKERYDKQISTTELNTIVRLHSVPKKSILLFNLKPKSGEKSLFHKLND